MYVDAQARFDVRQVVTGAGDQWIAGGALAISALTGSKFLAAGVRSGGAATTLRGATLVLVALDLTWYAQQFPRADPPEVLDPLLTERSGR